VQGSVVEELAETAAIGASLDGEDKTSAKEAFGRNIRYWQDGREPEPESIKALTEAIHRSVRDHLEQIMPDEPDLREEVYRRLKAATGPFAALAARYASLSSNAAEQHLLDFSTNLDQLGSAFTVAAEANDLERAKDIFLGANWLDEAYWSVPDPGQEDPLRNRETLRAAENWEQLTRATAPLVLNATLSWLSRLDLAVLIGGGSQAAHFPLFLPLLPRESSQGVKLPVPNLIIMLRSISREVSRRSRANSSSRAIRDGKDPPPDQEKLNQLRKDNVLSAKHFENLLCVLKPQIKPEPGERIGFDVYALNLAANTFSLLTARDGKPPSRTIRRKRPGSVTSFEAISIAYASWWRRNLRDVAGDAAEHPRPAWFIRSLGGKARRDRLR
jgi:hypothetical protein